MSKLIKYIFVFACVIIILLSSAICVFNIKLGNVAEVVSGTAFLINSDGDFVTAGHVVKNRTHFRLVIGNQVVEGKVVATDYWNDVAIVHTNYISSNYLLLQLNYHYFDKAVEYGYPLPDLLGNDIKVSFGYLTSSFFNSQFEYRGLYCPGDSGGPLISYNGVVGIVSTGWAPFLQYKCSNTLTGPKSSVLVKLANDNNIRYSLANKKDKSTMPKIDSTNVVEIYAW